VGILYLVALAVALTGMVVLDRRFRLFFWADAPRAAAVLGLGVVFFLVWDLFGIGAGIFFRGETSFMTGLVIAPELPIEEVFFLALLCYLTMNAYAAAGRMLQARGRGRATGSVAGGASASAPQRDGQAP